MFVEDTRQAWMDSEDHKEIYKAPMEIPKDRFTGQ